MTRMEVIRRRECILCKWGDKFFREIFFLKNLREALTMWPYLFFWEFFYSKPDKVRTLSRSQEIKSMKLHWVVYHKYRIEIIFLSIVMISVIKLGYLYIEWRISHIEIILNYSHLFYDLSRKSYTEIFSPWDSSTRKIIHTAVLSIEFWFFIPVSFFFEKEDFSGWIHSYCLHGDTVESFRDFLSSTKVRFTEMWEIWREK